MTSDAMSLEVCELEKRFGIISKHAANCLKHGDYVAVVSKRGGGPSACPVCIAERDQKRLAEEQRAMFERIAVERIERRLGSSLIPPRFMGKSFADYRVSSAEQQENLDICVGYAERFQEHYQSGRCMLMLGKVGTGKTHLASAIAGYVVVNHSMVAAYRTVTGILQFIKGSFDNRSEYTEAEAYEALTQPHLLVIDEAGATRPTEFEMSAMFTLINGRYEQQKPTILISNLMPDELGPVIGERCLDRLRENGGICLVFDWESARREVANG